MSSKALTVNFIDFYTLKGISAADLYHKEYQECGYLFKSLIVIS
ncbi:hypothetical protein [Niallia sp. FSL W8-0954]